MDASASGTPVSSGIAPRIGETQAASSTREARGSRACDGAPPSRSPRAPGRSSRNTSAKRMFLSRSHVADRGARDVAQVVGVEQQQRPQLGSRELRLRLLQARRAQTREVDSLLPVDRHCRAARSDVHDRLPDSSNVERPVQRFCTRLLPESTRAMRRKRPLDSPRGNALALKRQWTASARRSMSLDTGAMLPRSLEGSAETARRPRITAHRPRRRVTECRKHWSVAARG